MENREANGLTNGKSLVIACGVLKEQIRSLGDTPHSFMYLEQGLHSSPGMLRGKLQEAINSSKEYSLLLLGYGMCGGAMEGIKAGHHQKMIIPRIDDCIGLSLGSRSRYIGEFAQNPGTFYFTRGWIEAAEDPLKDFFKSISKYGIDDALWIAAENMKHYRRAVLIKTGGQDPGASREYVKKFAGFFNLDYEEVDGTQDYLKRLLWGPWEEDFIVLEEGNPVGRING